MIGARFTGASVILVAVVAATVGLPVSKALAAGSDTQYEDATGKLLDEEVFSDTPVEFALPQSLGEFVRPPSSQEKTGRMSLGVSGAYVLMNEEQGASKEFAGSGTGTEVEVFIRGRGGWDFRLGVSQVNEGLYSNIDMAAAQLERYLIGVSLPLVRSKSFGLTLGGGVAWSQLNIDLEDPNADVAGPGGFVDVGMTIPFGSHMGLEIKGRYISWQGEDGVGESGSEQSSVVAAGITIGF